MVGKQKTNCEIDWEIGRDAEKMMEEMMGETTGAMMKEIPHGPESKPFFVIEAKNLAFAYAESKGNAIESSSFRIRGGEIVFLSGSSGSGKTTLLNIINGIIPEVVDGNLKGELKIHGKERLKLYERSLILGNVFQNPRSQFFTTNTTSELVFQMENYGFSHEEMKKRLWQIVEEFGMERLLDRKIFGLSSGERQMLALLTVFIMDPDVIIFDEPSANLDYGNAMRLRSEILRMKEKGKTVLVADHRYFYLKGIVDKVLLVENGQVRTFEKEEEYVNYEYGKRVLDLFRHDYPKRVVRRSDEKILEIKGLSYRELLKEISVSFRRGEVTAMIGVNGAGKTTLARLISRLLRPDEGEIRGEGQALYIMQDADFQLFGSSCLKELEITQKDSEKNLNALSRLNLIDKKNRHPQMLSGGEKQRLQMAISLVSDNNLIILDEPTSGLDQHSMNCVADMVEDLKKQRSVLIISHDYEFIRKCADRIVYLKDAKMEADFYLTEENIERLNQIYKEMEVYYE